MLFKQLRRKRWLLLERIKIKKLISSTPNPKVILGAGTTDYQGWIKTDYPFFDITSEKHWSFIFNGQKAANLLCEHVLEHFSEKDNRRILKLAYDNLKKGGIIRIAVPDKLHPSSEYIDYVRPGGTGAGADDHKSFWDYQSYSTLLEEIGYKVNLLEFCTDGGEITTSKFDLENGIIHRSKSYGFEMNIDSYSSLIIDAKKV